MRNTDTNGKKAVGSYTRLFGLGFAFLMIMVVLVVAGLLVDGWLGTLPLFLLVGVALGFAGGLYYIYQSLKSLGG
ncbi:MAG: AtpZ/AtpI family protein [Rubrobacter sp.]|nr:AtpZ/AtpI family protein [Rubrobacter sp.]